MRSIFVNPAGQRDNIGDSILRRAYLNALRDKGTLHVLVGPDDGYNSGLGLQQVDVIYTSRVRWLLSVVSHFCRRDLTFAVNAGEFVGAREDKVRSTWQVAVAALARACGGQVIISGVSVRPGTRGSSTFLPLLAKLSSAASWRDSHTQQLFAAGTVQPDWAFQLGSSSTSDQRPLLAVALRGDRPRPSDAWVSSFLEFARQRDLEPIVVVQVRRDETAARELADRLGAQLADWPADADHAAQEAKVREIYRRSQFIASDRIHALIIAATEGSVPIGLMTSDPAKVQRTFEHLAPIGLVDVSAASDIPQWETAALRGNAVLERIPDARRALDELADRLVLIRH